MRKDTTPPGLEQITYWLKPNKVSWYDREQVPPNPKEQTPKCGQVTNFVWLMYEVERMKKRGGRPIIIRDKETEEVALAIPVEDYPAEKKWTPKSTRMMKEESK